MLGYLIGRLAQAVPVLVLASLAVFLVLRLVPGDPADSLAGEDATPAEVDAIREELGLKDPIPVQYARWIGDLMRGDLGVSIRTGIPVSRLVKLSFPPTIELAVASYVIAILIGIPLGTIAGVRPRSIWDWSLSFYTIGTLGVPNFLLGVLLLWLFSVNLGWFPVSGRVSIFDDPIQSIKYLALPAFALGSGLAAVLARYTRTTVQEAMGQDYIRTARAKGLSPRHVVVRHALRNSMIPVVTIMALQVGGILAGAVVIERVFTRPGLGRLVVDAIQNRDYLIVQSTLVILVVIFVGVNLLADIAYGFLDPRVRRR
ncbi:MAG: ABC transporter permease [Tepidiformaceae bacterium]